MPHALVIALGFVKVALGCAWPLKTRFDFPMIMQTIGQFLPRFSIVVVALRIASRLQMASLDGPVPRRIGYFSFPVLRGCMNFGHGVTYRWVRLA